ncbi:hypothetical protein ACFFU1_15650 [Algibacter miyuki]|uniref:STAS/SEC14 domain-containing protein n=1 Tax=Algibacter miyuki TaxID=1306933 RepID=A0ABV5H4V0_9FLAO|nr:hypothetical protein [Algibacter miyuki]MDN3665408.1 hypothetical protein [Algibacter miyuki]
MRFQDSDYYKILTYKRIEKPFDTYYLCDKFYISDINRGINFSWIHAQTMIDIILNFYGEQAKLGFITNRVNNYSVDPQNWVKAQKEHNFMTINAIVTYSEPSYKVSTLEKHFIKNTLKRCFSLEEAIKWVQNHDALK